jgi:hypothetical protein
VEIPLINPLVFVAAASCANEENEVSRSIPTIKGFTILLASSFFNSVFFERNCAALSNTLANIAIHTANIIITNTKVCAKGLLKSDGFGGPAANNLAGNSMNKKIAHL